MHATAEGPYVPMGHELRSHLALGLGRLAYVLFYLVAVALLISLPAGAIWLLWRWLAG